MNLGREGCSLMKNLLQLIILLAASWLLVGCSIIERPPFPMTESNIDPELMPYYEAFQDERLKLGFTLPLPHIDIVFADPVINGWRGHCYIEKEIGYGNNYVHTRIVYIDRKQYDKVMNRDGEGYHKGIEMLVFHELAHCFWEIGHTDNEYIKWKEVYDPETEAYVHRKVTCRDLMNSYATTYKISDDYWCYTQHYDLYRRQLHAIMSIGKPN